MERYSARVITISSDTENDLEGYTAEQVLQLARALKDANIVNMFNITWTIYDRSRGIIAAESDKKDGGWINPQWLIATGLSEQEGL